MTINRPTPDKDGFEKNGIGAGVETEVHVCIIYLEKNIPCIGNTIKDKRQLAVRNSKTREVEPHGAGGVGGCPFRDFLFFSPHSFERLSSFKLTTFEYTTHHYIIIIIIISQCIHFKSIIELNETFRSFFVSNGKLVCWIEHFSLYDS